MSKYHYVGVIVLLNLGWLIELTHNHSTPFIVAGTAEIVGSILFSVVLLLRRRYGYVKDGDLKDSKGDE